MAPTKRKSYSLKQKLDVLDAKRNSDLSGRKFAAHIGIDEATLSRRNRKHHRDSDTPEVKGMMGALPTLNFLYWEKAFPTFQLYLFLRSLEIVFQSQHLYEMDEFKYYYGASKNFYTSCFNIDCWKKYIFLL